MSKDIFVEKCMNLFSMSDQEIIKSILKDSLDNIEIDDNDKFPSDFTVSDITNYKPTKNTFPDFAYFLCTSKICLLYTSPSPRDGLLSRMPSSA